MSIDFGLIGRRIRINLGLALVLSLLPVIHSGSFSIPASALSAADCNATSVTGSLVRTSTADGTYCVVTFTSGSGNWVIPEGIESFTVLVVGGGGGGAGDAGGGGGGGGVFSGHILLSSNSVDTATITVGSEGYPSVHTSVVPEQTYYGSSRTNSNSLTRGGFSSIQVLGSGSDSLTVLSNGGFGGVYGSNSQDSAGGTGGVVAISDNTTLAEASTLTSATGSSGGKGFAFNSFGDGTAGSQGTTPVFFSGVFGSGGGGGASVNGGNDKSGGIGGTNAGNGGGGWSQAVNIYGTSTSITAVKFFATSGVANTGSGGGAGSAHGPTDIYQNPLSNDEINRSRNGRPGGSGVVKIVYTPDAPSQPLNLRITSSSSNSVGLTWSAPIYNGGAALTDYKVEYKIRGAATWTEFNPSTSTTTSETVSGLSASKLYVFRVSAVNGASVGAASNEVTSFTASGIYSLLDASETNSYSGSGNTWTDLTGLGRNASRGAETAAPSWNASGYFDFDGGDYFTWGTSSEFNFSGTQSFSINVLFSPDSDSLDSGLHALYGRQNSGVAGSHHLSLGNGKLIAHREVSPWSVSGSSTISSSRIYLGSLVYDGSTQTLSTYLNGNLETSTTRGSIASNTIQTYIGAYLNNNVPDYFFDGKIYSIAAFDAALTQTQVRGLFGELQPTSKIVFDANGSTGAMSDQSFTNAGSVTLAANTFTKSGFTFQGWATSPAGSVVYSNESATTLYGDTYLYAVFSDVTAPTVTSVSATLLSGSFKAGDTITVTVAFSETVTVTTGETTTTAGLTCGQGGLCSVGDTGPGGGIVFYDAGSNLSWGRYLEAAPATWSGGLDSTLIMAFCLKGAVTQTSATGYNNNSIGGGKTNTDSFVNTFGCNGGAVYRAKAYTGGGKNDWYLPNGAELEQMWAQRTALSILNDADLWGYWGSNETGPEGYMGSLVTSSGGIGATVKGESNKNKTRPIRAITPGVASVPRLTLATGGSGTPVTYESGSGTSQLIFTYTVAVGDASSDLDYVAVNSLSLNGATIRDAAGNDAILTLPSPGESGSLSSGRQLLIDTAKPTSSVTITPLRSNSTTVSVSVTVNESTSSTEASGARSATVYYSTNSNLRNPVSCGTYSGGSAGASSVTFSVDCILDSADGTYYLFSRGADYAGNIEDAPVSADDQIILDRTAPNAPTGLDLSSESDSGASNSDKITNATSLQISGSAEETSTVQVYVDGIASGSTCVTSSGSFNCTTSSPLSEGSKSITAKATDEAGNESVASSSLTVTIDRTGPSVETVTSTTSAGSYRTGDSINIRVIMNETVTAGASLILTLNTSETVTVTSESNGTVLIGTYLIGSGVNVSSLSVSSISLAQAAVDLAGNTQSNTTVPSGIKNLPGTGTYVVDSTPPTVLSVSSSKLNGNYRVGEVILITVTFSETVTVSGTPTLLLETGETDTAVNYSSGSGTAIIGFTYTVAAGNTSADLDYVDANSLQLNGGTIIDIAGNPAVLTLAGAGADGSLGGSKSLVIDTTPPSQLAPPDLTSASDSGYSNSDNFTNDDTPTLDVTGIEANATVTITASKSGSASVTCSVSSGSCTFSQLTEGEWSFVVIQSDLAGNSSETSTALILVIDKSAPTVNSFSTSSASGSYKSGSSIVLRALLSETVTSGSQITVILNSGASVILTSVDSATILTGNYLVSSADTNTAALAVTSYSLTTAPVDLAGETMTSTTMPGTNIAGTANLIIDISNPVITGPTGGPGAESSTVTVAENTTSVHTFSADETVTWGILGTDSGRLNIDTSTGVLTFNTAPNREAPTDSDSNNVYVATISATDAAGNVETQTVTITVSNVVETATVSSVSFSSTPASLSTYIIGDTITVTVSMSDTVTVTGTPRIELVGLANKFAEYISGDGTAILTFRYTVVGGDSDSDGLQLLADAIDLNGGSISNIDDGANLAADLRSTAVSTQSGQKVDGRAPIISSSTPANNSKGVETDANIVITFNKNVSAGTGNILIKTGSSTVETITVTDGTKVTFSGSQLTINPSTNLTAATSYYVLIDSTAIKDSSNNFFAGISADNVLGFTTKSTLSVTTPGSGLTAYLNLAYSLTVSTSGGSGSKAFILETGTLPAGLALNASTGVISGTATTAGSSALTIRVTDAVGTFVVTSSFTITVSTPTFRQFDNGKIRIGNSSGENSVNTKGNFQQPFYKATNGVYYKLTYSTYPLNFAFGSGSSVATSTQWNGNTITQDPVMSSQVIDYSGFVGTSLVGSGIRGYGTIISTGNFSFNGVTYRLKNTFTLDQNSSSIRVTNELTNLSASTTLTNVAFWAGTQDDWVGSSDGPTKTKGNIAGGSFAAISSTSTTSRALKITSGAEGVLFYTTYASANTVWDRCCSFANSYRKSPTSSAITGSGDGSYAIYFSVGSMAAGSTASFTWYYAAGPSSELASVESSLSALGSDVTAPTITGVTYSSSAGSDNTYKVGDLLSFQVSFSENVNVTGTPRIPIQGLSGKYATYRSGTGTSNLTFSYAIETSDLNSDGISINSNTLELNGGSISDPSANSANLSHSALSASTSHKVDGVLPTLSSSTPSNGATSIGITSDIVLNFSEAVSAGTGNISIKASSGDSIIEQIPVGDPRVSFSGNTVTINPNSILNSQTTYYLNVDSTAIVDSAGNAYAGFSNNSTLSFTTANASAPTVSGVTSSTSNGTYKPGSTISIQVTFSKIVTVTGTPTITLETGETDTAATYTSGSGSRTLTFTYTVQAGDSTLDLDYASTTALTLPGGSSIVDASNNSADRTLPAPSASGSLSASSAIVIDTQAPTLSSSTPANSATGVLETATIVLNFSESISAGTGTITITKSSNSSVAFSQPANNATYVTISGGQVTINHGVTFAPGENYYIEIANTAFFDLAQNYFGGISGSGTLSFTTLRNEASAPVFTAQPQSDTTTAGLGFTLSSTVAAPDRGILTYQWYFNGSPISGATSSSYNVTSATTADSGSYYVVVANIFGTTESTTSTTVTVTINPSLSLSYSGDIATTYGTSSSSSASVSGGTGTRSYTILKTSDSSTIAGIAISSVGLISIAETTTAGTYPVTVTVTDSESASATSQLTISIARKTVTVSGGIATSRTYNASRTATTNFGSSTLVGVLNADSLTVVLDTATVTALFDSALVGETKTVTVADLALSGSRSTNYLLTQPTLTANITKASQIITVTSTSPSRPTSGQTYVPTATSSASLPITITVDTTTSDICSISAGTVSFLTSGTCLLRFNQAGDSNYDAASQASQSVIVGKQTQTLSFTPISSKSYGSAAFQAIATASSGLVPQYSSTSNDSICTVTLAGVVKVKGVGDCVVVANQSGNAAFSAAAETSTSFAITANLPTAPRIAALSAGNNQITVSFTAPESDGGATITSYRVISTPEDKECLWTSGSLACTVQNVTNGRSYTFVVEAINSAGTGPQSSASPAITPVAAANAVENLAATPGDGQLTVSWNQPSDLGGGTFTEYQVFKKLATSTIWGDTVTITSISSTSHTYTGLVNGTAYDVRVVAITSANSSAITGNTAEIVQIPAQTPTSPRNVTIASPTGTNAVVTWNAPLDNGGIRIESYTVTATLGSRTLTCALNSPTDTSCLINSFTVSGGGSLRKGAPNPWDRRFNVEAQQVSVSVSAINTIGASEPGTGTLTLPTAPGAPTVTTVSAANGEMAISWTAPTNDGGSPITGYTATIFRRGATSALDTCSTSTTTCAIPATGSDYEYDFAVYAINAVGDGTSSALFSPPTPPAPASGPAAPVPAPKPEPITTPPSAPFGVLIDQVPSENKVLSFGSLQIIGSDAKVKTTLIDERVITMEAGSLKFEVQVKAPDGEARTISETQGRMSVVRLDSLNLEGNGLEPNTLMKFWILSNPILLGETLTTQSGSISVSFPIPNSVPLGEHTIQINGVTEDNRVVTFAFAVTVFDKKPEPAIKNFLVDMTFAEAGRFSTLRWTSNKEIVRVEIYGNDGSSNVITTSGLTGSINIDTLEVGVQYTAFAIPFDNLTINTYNGIEIGLPPRPAENLGFRTLNKNEIQLFWKNSVDAKNHKVIVSGTGVDRREFTTEDGTLTFTAKSGVSYRVEVLAEGVARLLSLPIQIEGVSLGKSSIKDSEKTPTKTQGPIRTTIYLGKKSGKLSATEMKLLQQLKSKIGDESSIKCVASVPNSSTKKVRSAAKNRAQSVCDLLGNGFPASTSKSLSMVKPTRTKPLSKFDRVDVTLIP